VNGGDIAWLLTWESEYGDEGEGRVYVAVYDHHDDAVHAQHTLPRPGGYSARGGYELTAVPRNVGLVSASVL
jgi:hypothetical protein